MYICTHTHTLSLTQAGRLTHKECGLCVEIAQEAALLQRKHVWVDGIFFY